MTASNADLPPPSSPSPQPPSPRPQRRWKIIALAGGIGGVLALGGGSVWAWRYIHTDLAPYLSDTLTRSLERPLQLGTVERVTLGSIRVGPSSLGATADDPTTVSAEAVEVHFNLLSALLTRRLAVDLRVFEADGYLEQDAEKGWLTFSTPERGPSQRQLFEVELEKIAIRDSQLTLMPLPVQPDQPYPILLEGVQGQLDIDSVSVEEETAQRFNFELSGSPTDGGDILFRGEVQPVAGQDPAQPIDRETDLEVQVDRAWLPDISAFTLSTLGFQAAPLLAESGRVSGNIDLAFSPDPEQPVAFSGTTQVTDGVVQVANWPAPLTDVDAVVRYQDGKVVVDETRAALGDLVATAEGTIDLSEGYDLTAEMAAVEIEDIADAFDVELPVALAGAFDADVAVTGPLDQPQVSGAVVATDTVTVDKLAFETVRTNYQLSARDRTLALTEMLAVPAEGGFLTGEGDIDFGGEAVALAFEIDGEALPGDAIAARYIDNLPLTLGNLSAQAQVLGSPGNLTTLAQWQAPEAQYPGQGTLTYGDGVLTFEDTTLAIAGGSVSGQGRLANGQWQADIAAAGVPLNPFQAQLSGELSGDFQLAGPVQNVSLRTVRGQGSYRVQQLAGGNVAGLATLTDGRWRTDVNVAGVALSQFQNRLSGQLNGSFQLAGDAQNFTPNSLTGSGDFQVAQLAGGDLTGTGSLTGGQWQANVNAAGVEISQFSPSLRGDLSGQVQLRGRADSVSPRTLRAEGDVALSQGLAGVAGQFSELDQPLTSAFAWNGSQLRIDSASSSQLQANGSVVPAFVGNQLTGIQRFDLDIAADRYPLAALPVQLPPAVNVAGLATFDG
ncbi:MAG: hypothetical protein AAFZ80_10120, partial [Cyanobacteria bacterium P01_A01_bin.105]